MNIAIRYYTKGGNTKKLADAIAEELNIEAKSIDMPLEENVDILFLGSSVYAAHLAAPVKEYIKANKDKIGKIVNFSTAAILKSTYAGVKKVCEKNGVLLDEKNFACKGSFGPMNKGRPNEEDLENGKKFAREIVG